MGIPPLFESLVFMREKSVGKIFPIKKKLEIPIVIALAFGYPIFKSIAHFLSPNPNFSFSNPGIIRLLVFEIIITALLFCFLKKQVFSLPKELYAPSFKLSFHGIILTVGYYFVYFILMMLLYFLPHSIFDSNIHYGQSINPILIFLLIIVNPVYEEFFVTAYIFESLKNQLNNNMIVFLSTFIRCCYHLYQGKIIILTILPLGLIYCFYYKKYRRIWPIVLSHGIIDLIAFSQL